MSDPYTPPQVFADLDLLGAEAVSSLRKFLSLSEHTSLDIGKARVAASALSAWTRSKQTESARETNFLVLARELANDKAEFRRFVKIAMPQTPLLKALPEPTAARANNKRNRRS